jgi:hypothetical protein
MRSTPAGALAWSIRVVDSLGISKIAVLIVVSVWLLLEADVFFAAKQKPQTLWAAARSKFVSLE